MRFDGYAYHVIVRVFDKTNHRDYEFVTEAKPEPQVFPFLCDKVLRRHMIREGRTDAWNFNSCIIASGYVEKLDTFLNS